MPAKTKASKDGRVSLAISQNDALSISATLAAAVITARGDKVLKRKDGAAAAAASCYYDVLDALEQEGKNREGMRGGGLDRA